MAIADIVTADYTTLGEVQDRFNDLAAAFRNAVTPLGTNHDLATDGAGRFRGDLEPGAVAFLISWREAFGVCAADAGLIAGNVGRTAVDLQAADIDASTEITL